MIILLALFSFSCFSMENYKDKVYVDSASLIVYRKKLKKEYVLVGTKGLINYHNFKKKFPVNKEILIEKYILKNALRPTFLGGKVQRGETPRQAALREFFEESGLDKNYSEIDYKKLAKKLDLRLAAVSKPYKNKRNKNVVSKYFLVSEEDLNRNNIFINTSYLNKVIADSVNCLHNKNIRKITYQDQLPELVNIQWVEKNKITRYFDQKIKFDHPEISKLENFIQMLFPQENDARRIILYKLENQDYNFKRAIAHKILYYKFYKQNSSYSCKNKRRQHQKLSRHKY